MSHRQATQHKKKKGQCLSRGHRNRASGKSKKKGGRRYHCGQLNKTKRRGRRGVGVSRKRNVTRAFGEGKRTAGAPAPWGKRYIKAQVKGGKRRDIRGQEGDHRPASQGEKREGTVTKEASSTPVKHRGKEEECNGFIKKTNRNVTSGDTHLHR